MHRSEAAARQTLCWSQIGVIFSFGLLWLITALACPAQSPADGGLSAEAKAFRFLSAQERGREVLAYVHFGSDYVSHEYERSVQFDDGTFAQYYRFVWKTTEVGRTEVAFQCDANGKVVGVTVVGTDAVWNQPFLVADLSIQAIGRFLFAEYRDRMTAEDRRIVQPVIEDADARGLLVWGLRLEQRL